MVPLGAEKVRRGSGLAAWCNYGNLCCSNVLFNYHIQWKNEFKFVFFTIPLGFNTGEEVHTTEAQSVSRNQGYVHLQKTGQKEKEQK